MGRADLHTHSTISDGRLSPAALVEQAAGCGLTLMALTDHDNVGGLEEAQVAGRRHGVEVIAGVEISADYEPGTMHILGLGIDPKEAGLVASLDFLQKARRDRNPKMIQKLHELGMPITLEEVAALAGSQQVGRPHFAQALLNHKLVGSFGEAFERFFGKGCPAYVPKERLSSEQSIALIHGAGGVAVLAHPIQLKLEGAALETLIEGLVAQGLDGLEVFHIDHDAEHEQHYLKLAKQFHLKISGGSDYHAIPGRKGELGKPGLELTQARELLARVRA